jgi:predicted dehydrogenase
MTAPPPIGLAVIGHSGHQPSPEEAAAAGAVITVSLDAAGLEPRALRDRAREICADPTTHLVSVDLTPRSRQVDVAVIALEMGRNVLIERPAATTTAEVNRLAAAARASTGQLWERATTFFDEPARRAGAIIAAGEIGEVILVTAHRSYPWAPWRDADERISGGLVLQSAGYGLDIARLATGRRIHSVTVLDTAAGEPSDRSLRMAAIVSAQLEGGAIASIVVDYLKTPGPSWGRDEVRIVGTRGLIALDGIAGTLEVTTAEGTRLVQAESAPAALLRAVVDTIRTGRPSVPPASHLIQSTAALVDALENRRTTAIRDEQERP